MLPPCLTHLKAKLFAGDLKMDSPDDQVSVQSLFLFRSQVLHAGFSVGQLGNLRSWDPQLQRPCVFCLLYSRRARSKDRLGDRLGFPFQTVPGMVVDKGVNSKQGCLSFHPFGFTSFPPPNKHAVCPVFHAAPIMDPNQATRGFHAPYSDGI